MSALEGSKPRVLITGGSGFIGSACVRAAVNAGLAPCVVIDRNVPETVYEAEHVHVADLLDADEVSRALAEVRPTVLLHLAWMTTHGAFWSSPENPKWVGASMHLLKRFVENGGRRAVLVGTCAEYDWTGSGLCNEATSPLVPATLYGQAKNALRERAMASAEASGLSLAWARLFFPYGPGENPNRLIPSVVLSLLAGRPAETTAGTQIRDLLYVGDVADALLAVLASDVTGAVNVGSGESASLREAVELTADLLGRRDLLRLGARSMSPDDPGCLLADTTRLNREVGWKPRLTLREGLVETIDYWKRRDGGA